MRNFTVLVLLFFGFSMFGQETDLNQYKYIIVPKKFDFQKQPNQYRVSTFTKHYFEEYGFTAIYEGELPADLKTDPCIGLKADLENSSNLFTTKLNVVLKDCHGTEVYSSGEGKSKIKEFEPAYQDALEKAFATMEGVAYSYSGPVSTTANVAVVPAAVPAVVSTPVIENEEVAENTEIPAETPVEAEDAVKVLYAQPLENGYQLVDLTPKVVFVLLKTSAPDMFILKNKKGTVTKVSGEWVAEYYDGEKLVKETLNIKF